MHVGGGSPRKFNSVIWNFLILRTGLNNFLHWNLAVVTHYVSERCYTLESSRFFAVDFAVKFTWKNPLDGVYSVLEIMKGGLAMSKSLLQIFRALAVVFSVFFLVLPALSQRNNNIESQAKRFIDSTEAQLQDNSTLYERFSLLRDLAPAALAAGDLTKAKKYGRELQAVGEEIKKNSNIDSRMPSYATHASNIVLGLIALDEGRIAKAKEHLLAAGQFSGGPDTSLMTWGPNMLLAKKLLEKGERETVVQYFDSCSKFWERENGRLAKWKREVNEGEMPDFAGNLRYVVDNWRFKN